MEELLGFIPGAGQGLPEQRQTDRKPDTHTHRHTGEALLPSGVFYKGHSEDQREKKINRVLSSQISH